MLIFPLFFHDIVAPSLKCGVIKNFCFTISMLYSSCLYLSLAFNFGRIYLCQPIQNPRFCLCYLNPVKMSPREIIS